MSRVMIVGWLLLGTSLSLSADEVRQVLDDRLHHLRGEGPKEWAEFPDRPEGAAREVRFSSTTSNPVEWTLKVRQQDVKQQWSVTLNGKPLGRLVGDENEMLVYFPLPKGMVIAGENRLFIQQPRPGKTPDDIRAGEITLDRRPMADVLGEAELQIKVKDKISGQLLPARITITDQRGALQTTGANSNDHLAVRPGVVYTSTGIAEVPLPAGMYKIFAGRGFEYSLDSATVTLKAGETKSLAMTIFREVPTEGYAACDTHVHTLTHSGHGDSTVQERMITLTGEGIELPIATDHNVFIDHRPFAKTMRVQQDFTPVIGNEVTTGVGHFNVFPATPDAKPPNHRLEHWGAILERIHQTPGVKFAILNHARDLHRGVRPFGPKLFNEAVGRSLEDRSMVGLNGMEVINSSAIQSHPLQLCQDWMAVLNSGTKLTPIGSSDSHDVARHFVGQGRTYIRMQDRDPGNLDIQEAVSSLLAGRVLVSYGLIAELTIADKYQSGDVAKLSSEDIKVRLRVLGPHWVRASKVQLYQNGEMVREINIPKKPNPDLPTGVKWQSEWTLPRPKHDGFLTAIATGPGIEQPFWRSAKPYQPKSPNYDLTWIGCSGAVWLDADGDGQITSARDYATKVVAKSGGDFTRLVQELSKYDAAVAAQAAEIYQAQGESLLTPQAQQILKAAAPAVKTGFQNYLAAWRKNQIARSQLK